MERDRVLSAYYEEYRSAKRKHVLRSVLPVIVVGAASVGAIELSDWNSTIQEITSSKEFAIANLLALSGAYIPLKRRGRMTAEMKDRVLKIASVEGRATDPNNIQQESQRIDNILSVVEAISPHFGSLGALRSSNIITKILYRSNEDSDAAMRRLLEGQAFRMVSRMDQSANTHFPDFRDRRDVVRIAQILARNRWQSLMEKESTPQIHKVLADILIDIIDRRI